MLPAAANMIATLSAVQEAQRVSGNVAEIGVHHGKLFILLYLLARGDERAVAVDLFADQTRNVDQSGGGDLDKFLVNLARHADADMRRLVVHEGDSTALDGAALRRLAGGVYRLISIDGGHTAETTAHDLAIAVEALAPGGVIILDDYFNEMWPGVSESVHRYFRERRGILPAGPTRCFSVRQTLSRFMSIRCAPSPPRRLSTTFLVLAFFAATLPRCPSLSASARTAGGAQLRTPAPSESLGRHTTSRAQHAPPSVGMYSTRFGTWSIGRRSSFHKSSVEKLSYHEPENHRATEHCSCRKRAQRYRQIFCPGIDHPRFHTT